MVLTPPIKFLIFGVVITVPVVDAVAHFYHACYITVRNLCEHERLKLMVYQAIFLQRITKNKQKISCSYCCVANFSPFSCHFPLLQHRLNDLEIFQPITQILLHLRALKLDVRNLNRRSTLTGK